MKKVQKRLRDLPSEEIVKLICKVANDKKAENVVALDVRGISSFADYFVIMSGTSTRHVSGLAGAIGDREGALGRRQAVQDEWDDDPDRRRR